MKLVLRKILDLVTILKASNIRGDTRENVKICERIYELLLILLCLVTFYRIFWQHICLFENERNKVTSVIKFWADILPKKTANFPHNQISEASRNRYSPKLTVGCPDTLTFCTIFSWLSMVPLIPWKWSRRLHIIYTASREKKSRGLRTKKKKLASLIELKTERFPIRSLKQSFEITWK